VNRITILASSLTKWWVSIYTRGLPQEVKNARLEELRSDVWESTNDPNLLLEGSTKTAWRLLSRLVFGVPQDIAWRIEAGRSSGVGNGELAKVGAGAGLVALLLLAAIIGPIFAPHEPLTADNMARLAAPGGHHLLGTNHEGRDVLSRPLFALHLNIIGSLLFALPAIALGRLLIVMPRQTVAQVARHDACAALEFEVAAREILDRVLCGVDKPAARHPPGGGCSESGSLRHCRQTGVP
jgi:hypothetical protein